MSTATIYLKGSNVPIVREVSRVEIGNEMVFFWLENEDGSTYCQANPPLPWIDSFRLSGDNVPVTVAPHRSRAEHLDGAAEMMPMKSVSPIIDFFAHESDRLVARGIPALNGFQVMELYLMVDNVGCSEFRERIADYFKEHIEKHNTNAIHP